MLTCSLHKYSLVINVCLFAVLSVLVSQVFILIFPLYHSVNAFCIVLGAIFATSFNCTLELAAAFFKVCFITENCAKMACQHKISSSHVTSDILPLFKSNALPWLAFYMVVCSCKARSILV